MLQSHDVYTKLCKQFKGQHVMLTDHRPSVNHYNGSS